MTIHAVSSRLKRQLIAAMPAQCFIPVTHSKENLSPRVCVERYCVVKKKPVTCKLHQCDKAPEETIIITSYKFVFFETPI